MKYIIHCSNGGGGGGDNDSDEGGHGGDHAKRATKAEAQAFEEADVARRRDGLLGGINAKPWPSAATSRLERELGDTTPTYLEGDGMASEAPAVPGRS